jgi:glyoxylase-like metal-dependent hydrolase (beta-lactamase superfamily II)
VEELRAGLWYWTAVHPSWRPENGGPTGWEQEVGSYAWDAGSELVLLDPQSPPTLVDELAGGKEVAVVLTCDWHDRSAAETAERLGAVVHLPAGGDGGVEGRAFEPDSELPGGVVAYQATHPGEVVLWIAEAAALVVGDALVNREGRLEIPTTWLPEGDTVADVHERLAPLLELPVELVLVTHGEPVRENGAEALRSALLQSTS